MQAEWFGVVASRLGSRLRSTRGIAQKVTFGLLAATLAATAVLPALAGDPPRALHGAAQGDEQDVSAAAKRRGRKTVTKTFSNGGGIAVPVDGAVENLGPADPYPLPIPVAGFKKAKIVDVNLTLRGFSHTTPVDVQVMLVAPGGRNAVLMGDVGFNGGQSAVTNLTLKLDDEAAGALPEIEQLTSGSFRPLDGGEPGPDGNLGDFPAPAPAPSGTNALSTFDGINPNGQWQLFVLDDGASDRGSIGEVTLEIKAKSKRKKRR